MEEDQSDFKDNLNALIADCESLCANQIVNENRLMILNAPEEFFNWLLRVLEDTKRVDITKFLKILAFVPGLVVTKIYFIEKIPEVLEVLQLKDDSIILLWDEEKSNFDLKNQDLDMKWQIIRLKYTEKYEDDVKQGVNTVLTYYKKQLINLRAKEMVKYKSNLINKNT